MSSNDMTVDQALARIMEATRITDEAERRKTIRSILQKLHYSSWTEGNNAADQATWWDE